ncbi:hypothetical protein X975_09458, partial [Stegodyphus mimosarum]
MFSHICLKFLNGISITILVWVQCIILYCLRRGVCTQKNFNVFVYVCACV